MKQAVDTTCDGPNAPTVLLVIMSHTRDQQKDTVQKYQIIEAHVYLEIWQLALRNDYATKKNCRFLLSYNYVTGLINCQFGYPMNVLR